MVHVWWYSLSAIAFLNLGIWGWSTARFLERHGRHARLAPRFPHVLLSGGYVLGCAFRSLLPRADVQRIVVYDSWLSSVLVGRSVATIAELCFAAQWALILRELSRDHDYPLGEALSRLVFPLICVAELFSWYAVLSTNFLGNTLEQSIWTATVALLAIAMAPLWRRAVGALRTFLGLSIAFSGAFVVFMCTVDVRMYLTRWLADEASGRSYLSLGQGLQDLATRWVVTHSLVDWREEMAWMSLYFSAAVWYSISLVHAPRAAQVSRSSYPQRQLAREPQLSLPAE